MSHRTALLAAAGLGAALLLSGCGSSSLPPEAVVRAWNDAVVTRADDRAGRLLAVDAIVIEAGGGRVLRTREEAVAWMRTLPCAGLVKTIQTHQDIVTATFVLGDREAGSCAARGGTMTAEFEVRDNRIVFFRVLSSSAAAPAAPG